VLFVDATNVMLWGANPPTGIPRVEAGLVREILSTHPASVGLFAFDPTLRRCRSLNEKEKSFVREWLGLSRLMDADTARRIGALARFGNVFQVYSSVAACAGREAHRAIAQYLSASPERSGVVYETTRLAVRLVFGGARLAHRVAHIAATTKDPDPLQTSENSCLISINTCSLIQKHYSAARLKASLSLLVYDTIPLDYPDLAAHGHAARFQKYFCFGAAHARQLLCISEATRLSVIRWCRKDPRLVERAEWTHVVHIASSLSESTSAAESLPTRELVDRAFVLCCATIEPRKNHALLLRIWSRLLKPQTDPVPLLVFVGRWGWRTEAIRQQISEDPRLASMVRVYTSVSDDRLRWLYRTARFCVFPSIAEGWGLGASEALDFGTPVVISDIPPLREATQGLMPAIPIEDEDLWEKTVRRLIAVPADIIALQKSIAENYRRRQVTEFATDILRLLGTPPVP
jgi:glycosyltransferase involved in cell wall biosynthesis